MGSPLKLQTSFKSKQNDSVSKQVTISEAMSQKDESHRSNEVVKKTYAKEVHPMQRNSSQKLMPLIENRLLTQYEETLKQHNKKTLKKTPSFQMPGLKESPNLNIDAFKASPQPSSMLVDSNESITHKKPKFSQIVMETYNGLSSETMVNLLETKPAKAQETEEVKDQTNS